MQKKENDKGEWIDDTLYGVHSVTEALKAGTRLDKILLKKEIGSDIRTPILELAKEADVQVQFVPVEKIDRSAPRGATHQGVVAFLSLIEYSDVEEVVMAAKGIGKIPLMLMLDQVSDVRNFAAIARSAECFGVDGIIIPKTGAARINADAMKISSGALNHIPVCKVDHLGDTALLLKEYGLRIVACSEKGKAEIFSSSLIEAVCLVMGSEDEGITYKLLKLCDDHVFIPMAGKIGSLNVSVAAGIAMMETVRQRANNATHE
jgi:23S rRNA (guanosine2251-2'-O)-methyltransferase